MVNTRSVTEAVLILPCGITGFNVPAGNTGVNPQDFYAVCWQAVAPLGGRVEDRPQVLAPDFTSFHALVLVLPAGEVAALLNKVHPWLGFCRPLAPGDCDLEFVDPGAVAAALAAHGGYRVFAAGDLDRPVDVSMCADLGRAEQVQLAYWGKLAGRAKLRVGDVVFNFWD